MQKILPDDVLSATSIRDHLLFSVYQGLAR